MPTLMVSSVTPGAGPVGNVSGGADDSAVVASGEESVLAAVSAGCATSVVSPAVSATVAGATVAGASVDAESSLLPAVQPTSAMPAAAKMDMDLRMRMN